MVDFTGRQVIVFGGGAVAVRKAGYFAQEAEVTAFSRSFHPDFTHLPVVLHTMELTHDIASIREMIKESTLVVAATSDQELNSTIMRACSLERIFCNVASGSAGDVMLPAKITGERYVIGISTRGSVPAVSRYIRECLEEKISDLDALIELGEWIRREFRTGIPVSRNYDSILYEVLRDPQTHIALTFGQEMAQKYIREKYGG